jgi:hypothetical protein
VEPILLARSVLPPFFGLLRNVHCRASHFSNDRRGLSSMSSNPIHFQPGVHNRHNYQRQEDLSEKLENLILQPGTSRGVPVPCGPGGVVVGSAVGKPIEKGLYKHKIKKVLRQMKREHMDLNQVTGPSGLTPLQVAGASNNQIAAHELKKAGAEPNYPGSRLNFYS